MDRWGLLFFRIMLERFLGYPLFLVLLLSACGDGNSSTPTVTDGTLSLEEIDRMIISDPKNAALFAKRARFQEGRDSVAAALKDWSRAVTLDSTSAEWRIGLGDLFYRKVDMASAEAQFLAAIRFAPRNTEARLKMAEIQLVNKDYKEAMRWANDALRINDQDARAYFLKGWIHRAAGDTALAISSYHTAVERDPRFYDAYIALGLIHASKGDPLALEFYNTAVELRPLSVEAWYDRGMYAQENGMDSVAIASYSKIKEIDPKNPTAWYNTGYILLQHKQLYAEARNEFSEAIAVLPTYSQAYYNRGLTYEMEGKLDSALTDYKQALVLMPDFDLAAEGLGRMQQRGLKVR